MLTVSLSFAALALTSPAFADDEPIGRERASPALAGKSLALAIPRLEPFQTETAQSDEITVYTQRLAIISPASVASRVALVDTQPQVRFSVRAEPAFRLALPLASSFAEAAPPQEQYGFDGGIALAARSAETGLDVGFAQRTRLQSDDRGERIAQGAEVRIGQRLRGLVADFKQPTWDRPAWYLFAASDGQALTWTPAQRDGAREPIRVQDRVTIGDLQAGVSVEANGLQASLTYLQREVSNAQRSERQEFTGIALTWRR